MYKTLGRRVAEHPEIVKPTIETFDWAFIVAFKKEGAKLKRYKKVFKNMSRNKAREEARAMAEQISLEYIAIVHKYRSDAPEIIFERGNKKLLDEWLLLHRLLD